MLESAPVDADSSLERDGGDIEVAHNDLGNASSAAIQPNSDRRIASETITPGWRFYLIFAALAVASLAAALDATSLTVALPIITQDLHGTGIEAFWAGTAYLLTSTVVQLPLAALSHIFGRKPIVCDLPLV